MSNLQRLILGVCALCAWALLWVVSLAANAKFGWTLGSSDLERMLLAGGSVASDFFKAATPLALLLFVAQRRWWPAAAAAMVGVVSITFSIVAATGFISTERWSAADRANLSAMRTEDAKSELERQKAARDWGVTARPVAVVEADIAAREANKIFRTTNQCTRTGRVTEEWCREYQALKVELASAQEMVKAEKRVSEIRSDFYSADRLTGDYQVEFWANVTSNEHSTVLLWMIILTVLLIELGSAAGLTIAMALLGKEGSPIRKAVRVVVGREKKGGDNDGGDVKIVKAPKPAGMTAMERALTGPFGGGYQEEYPANSEDQPRIVRKIGLKAGTSPAH